MLNKAIKKDKEIKISVEYKWNDMRPIFELEKSTVLKKISQVTFLGPAKYEITSRFEKDS